MTDSDNVRLAAANLLLDRGVRYVISDAPLFWQLLRLNRVDIRPLKAGALIEIGRIIDENKLDKIETVDEAKLKIEAIVKIIAVAVLNHRGKIKYFSPFLSKILLWKVPVKVLFSIFYHIIQVNNLTDFINITRYFNHQVQMLMNPKIQGQQEMGS
ncbi:hypothetical protein [Dysgonomonas reticulitermitis]